MSRNLYDSMCKNCGPFVMLDGEPMKCPKCGEFIDLKPVMLERKFIPQNTEGSLI